MNQEEFTLCDYCCQWVEKKVVDWSLHKQGFGVLCKDCSSGIRSYKFTKQSIKDRVAEEKLRFFKTGEDHEYKREIATIYNFQKEITSFYSEAKFMETCSGVEYEVDHIVPLRGENVWGASCSLEPICCHSKI